MPIYTYRCSSCETEFEVLSRLGDEAPACPECGALDVKRAVSRIAPAGKTAGAIASARRQAAAEGHFSNYSKAERAKVKS